MRPGSSDPIAWFTLATIISLEVLMDLPAANEGWTGVKEFEAGYDRKTTAMGFDGWFRTERFSEHTRRLQSRGVVDRESAGKGGLVRVRITQKGIDLASAVRKMYED